MALTRIGLITLVVLIAVLAMGTNLAGAEQYKYVTQWGSYGTLNGQFKYPQGIAVDDEGYVYVADMENKRIQQFSPSGTYIREWAAPDYLLPYDIAVDENQNLYVSFFMHKRILRIPHDGSPSSSLYVDYVTDGWITCSAYGLDIDYNGNIYLCGNDPSDGGTSTVAKYTLNWTFLRSWGNHPRSSEKGEFNGTIDVAADSLGHVFVTDVNNCRVQKFTANGVYLTKWGRYGTGSGEFTAPAFIAVDSQDYVYVTDFDTPRVQKFTANGAFVTQWGSYGTGDGQFNQTCGIAVDREGNVYVVDRGNHRVQKFTKNFGETDFTISPNPGRINQEITFDASPSITSGPTVYAWIFGDGSQGEGMITSHAFNRTGQYYATLTITDANGTRGIAKEVVITDPLTVTSVEPGTAERYNATPLELTITGTGFTKDTKVTFRHMSQPNKTFSAHYVDYMDSDHIRCGIYVSSTCPIGNYAVVVTTPQEKAEKSDALQVVGSYGYINGQSFSRRMAYSRLYIRPASNALITLHNLENGEVLNTTADSKGQFSFPSVPVGVYDVISDYEGDPHSEKVGPIEVFKGTETYVYLPEYILQDMNTAKSNGAKEAFELNKAHWDAVSARMRYAAEWGGIISDTMSIGDLPGEVAKTKQGLHVLSNLYDSARSRGDDVAMAVYRDLMIETVGIAIAENTPLVEIAAQDILQYYFPYIAEYVDTTGAGLVILWSETMFYQTQSCLFDYMQDPPDMEYTTLYYEPMDGPRIPEFVLNESDPGYLNQVAMNSQIRLVNNYTILVPAQNTTLRTYEKYQGAFIDNNSAWQEIQLDMLASSLQREIGIRRNISENLLDYYSAVSEVGQDIDAAMAIIQDEVYSNGFSPNSTANLTESGYDSADLQNFRTILLDYNTTEICRVLENKYAENEGRIAALTLFLEEVNKEIAALDDTTPPGDIQALTAATIRPDSITWTWIDPSDPDFEEVWIELNGEHVAMVPKGTRSYTADNLTGNTEYTMSTRTVDTSQLIGSNWINTTAWTAASPTPDWVQCVGGSHHENSFSVQNTTDGGFVIAGFTNSSDGDFSAAGYHGNEDAFVAKLNSSHGVEWTRILGGSGSDYGRSVQQTTDGGFILAGYTTSTDGNFSASGPHGDQDGFVARLSSNGSVLWVHCIGGTYTDRAMAVQQTSDGGFILAGNTGSSDGDFADAGRHNYYDAFALKLNATGAVQWARCVGGSNPDYGTSVQQTRDGGYLLAGYTNSSDGNFSAAGFHGNWDAFAARLSPTGTVQWARCIGGPLGEDYGYSVRATTDDGVILCGESISIGGDFSGAGNHGLTDAFLAKINATGAPQWTRCIGGSNRDTGRSVTQTPDGGFVLVGSTSSSDGNFTGTGYHGYYDAFVAKTDSAGAVQWARCIGGPDDENGNALDLKSDGRIVVAGLVEAEGGDMSGCGYHGAWDAFLASISDSAIPSLSVVLPNGGETYYLGSTLPMSWTYTGDLGSTVNIDVLKGTAILKTLTGISIGSSGSGSYNVTIPASTPLGSNYTIRVTSASDPEYTDTSDGSFTISGPTITVMTPNGGETFNVGSTLPMNWTYHGNPGSTVNIEVIKGGATLKTLPGIPIGSGGSGSYSVTIPASTPLGTDYKIRVTSASTLTCTDTSNGSFAIGVDPGSSITVQVPNGGENWVQGSLHTLRWTYAGTPGTMVMIEALRGETVLAVITPGTPLGSGGSGSFDLTFPYNTPLASDYCIRVSSTTNPGYSDTSDHPFTIISAITVSTPNGGEEYKIGSALPMSWTYSGTPGSTVNIDVIKGGAVLKTLTGIPLGASGSGSYPVTIPASTPQGTDYLIRVTSGTYAACTDTSNGMFTISA